MEWVDYQLLIQEIVAPVGTVTPRAVPAEQLPKEVSQEFTVTDLPPTVTEGEPEALQTTAPRSAVQVTA